MQDINFLLTQSGYTAKDQTSNSNRRVAFMLFILLILIAAGGKLSLMAQVKMKQNQVAQMESFIRDNAIVYTIEGNIGDYNVQLNKTTDLLQRLAKANTKNSEVFEKLGRGLPSKVNLTSYHFAENKTVVVNGIAVSKEEIAHYTWSLKQLKVFKNVLLDSVSREMDDGSTVEQYRYQFTVEL